LAAVFAMGCGVAAVAAPAVVTLPGDQAYPESITSTADGTLYVGGFATGGVLRVRPGASQVEPWIKPGAYDSRSTLGVLADEASKTLWICVDLFERPVGDGRERPRLGQGKRLERV